MEKSASNEILKLRDLIKEIYNSSSEDFSGIGIILYQNISDIPIFPLRKSNPDMDFSEVIYTLSSISSHKSDYHDGFHLVSSTWELTHVSQYFSPKITPEIKLCRESGFGGRYLAALFGSKIIGVNLCGIASKNFGLAIFKDGTEILFEDL
ncbi:hypothetical protein ACILPN_05205 [Yersinia wautersii]|nr:hypothetical protein [Yersinia pseudotuberculosis]